uniref:Hypoxia up-regulated protein 1 n=1 Tax=Culicoides sonorensis TaxID=179676 RepID=A0A336ME43_CULSO
MINFPILGIDFGAERIVASVFDPITNENVQIVTDSSNNRMFASCVAFTENERLLMNAAIFQATANPENTIFGRDMKNKLQSNRQFQISYKNKPLCLYVEHVIGMLIRKVKESAETLVNQEIKHCIIAIPVKYSNNEKLSMKMACEFANLEVLEMIYSPIAAATTYLKENSRNKDEILMIIDMGATSINVASVKIKLNGTIEILNLNGDLNLGGDDFTLRLIEHFTREFEQNTGVKCNQSQMIRLRTGSAKIKKILSTQKNAKTTIDIFHNLESFNMNINVEKFEELCSDLFKRCHEIIERIFRNDCGKIEKVIVVGGGCRIPKFLQIVQEITEKPPLRVLNQDEAVAKGAAYYATLHEINKIHPIYSLQSNDQKRKQEILALEDNLQYDEQERNKILQITNDLEAKCYSYRRSTENDFVKLKCTEIISWINKNKDIATYHDYEEKIEELEAIVSPDKENSCDKFQNFNLNEIYKSLKRKGFHDNDGVKICEEPFPSENQENISCGNQIKTIENNIIQSFEKNSTKDTNYICETDSLESIQSSDCYKKYFDDAKILFKKKQYEKSIDRFNELETMDISGNLMQNVLYYRGMAYFHLKKYEFSQKNFAKMLNIVEESRTQEILLWIQISKAKQCFDENSYEVALNYIENFQTIVKTFNETLQIEFFALLADIHFNLGNYKMVKQYCDTVLKLSPRHLETKLLIIKVKQKERKNVESGKHNFWTRSITLIFTYFFLLTFQITDIKRLLSGSMLDNSLVINKKDEKKFVVQYKKKELTIDLTNIISILLKKAKEIAEQFTKKEIKSCVIVISDNYPRQIIEMACELAKLNLKATINDSLAATLTYAKECLTERKPVKQNLLVVDLGAVSMKLEIIRINNTKSAGKIKSRSLITLVDFGGEDFILKLRDHFKPKSELTNTQLLELRNGCEKILKILSTQSTAVHSIEVFDNEKSLELQMTRYEFENNICRDLFDKFRSKIQQIMKISKKFEISHVIVVGGGVRMPKIQEILKEVTKLEPLQVLNQNEANAKGAVYWTLPQFRNENIKVDTGSVFRRKAKKQLLTMRQVENEFKRDEEERQEVVELLNELEKRCYDYERCATKRGTKEICKEALEWLNMNNQTCTVDEVKERMKKLHQDLAGIGEDVGIFTLAPKTESVRLPEKQTVSNNFLF